jgi:hypothetical protein
MMSVRQELPDQQLAPAIDRIQQVLASFAVPRRFATRRSAGTDDLRLDVVDFVPIPLPCRARYGLREKTLLDRRVRDTWLRENAKMFAAQGRRAAERRSST